jgi:ribosome biogenesis GTPase
MDHFFNDKGRYEVNKTLKKARKELKNSRQTKRVRNRNWQADDYDEFEDAVEERIIPRGERERRKQVQLEALAELDDDAAAPAQPADRPGETGVVTEVSSGFCRVDLGPANPGLICTVRGTLTATQTGFTNVVAVGDNVRVSLNGPDQGVIEAVLPRRSALVRPEAFHGYKKQVIAANVDQLLIVVAWRNPPIWLELIDRYLIAARRNNLSPVICLNKVDLADDVATCRAELAPYADLNYELIYTSTVTGYGIDALRARLRHRTTVLAGVSGVGKSSLLTAVQPGSTIRVGAVNADSGEGRHTTTQASRHPLAMGGAVIDTPGIREFGLSGLQPAELAGFYPDLDEVAPHCRFGNCTHIHEPDCRVMAAVDQGQLSAARYHNYKKIYAELATG